MNAEQSQMPRAARPPTRTGTALLAQLVSISLHSARDTASLVTSGALWIGLYCPATVMVDGSMSEHSAIASLVNDVCATLCNLPALVSVH